MWSFSAALAFFALVPFASAFPHPQASAVGAVYWTNNEAENTILVADTFANGTISFSGTYKTGGAGAHGITNPITGPDPLFSQGAVRTHHGKALLGVVNAGSNTASLFSINRFRPSQLKAIGKPAALNGQFPTSIGYNKAGTQAYILSTGAVNGVELVNVDPWKGFVPVPGSFRSLGLNQTTLPHGPPGTAGDVFYSADGSKLYVSVKESAAPKIGYLAEWTVRWDGTLSSSWKKISATDGSVLVWGATLIPGRNAVLTADGSIGADVFDLDTGVSHPLVVPGQALTCWSGYSQQTKNYYLSDPGTATITELSIDNNLIPSIVTQYKLPAGSLLIDFIVATFAGKDYIYVLAPGKSSIYGLTLNAPGQASVTQTVDLKAVAPNTPISNNLQGIDWFSSF